MQQRVQHESLSSLILLPPFYRVSEEHYRSNIGSELAHSHNTFQIITVINGSFQIDCNSQKYELSSGDAILIPAGCRHNWHALAETVTIQILLDPAIRQDYGEIAGLIAQVQQYPQTVSLPEEAPREFHEQFLRFRDRLQRGDNLFLLAALLQLLGHVLHHAQFPGNTMLPPGIQTVLQKIAKNPAQPFTLSKLATLANLSTSRFSELFREATGVSPIEFVIRQRLERAKMLLQGTRLSLEEIVEKLNWRSVPYFIRKFKSSTGMTPAAYRRNFQNFSDK